MNGSSTVNYPINEQLIGKFHVVNVDKLPANNHDEIITNNIPPMPSTADESVCASRFQMIRVDRNFGRGRWKVNDYEPPENTPISIIPPVNTIENESIQLSNTNIPTAVTSDSNATSSAALAATAASATNAAAALFHQQQLQQRLALVNTSAAVPTNNVQPPPGLLHGYPPGALANLAASNQSYLLANHPQFSYYAFYPTHYSPYANSWANALAASNPYLQPPPQQTGFQLPTGNPNDTATDMNGENSMMSGGSFPNQTTDHLQNAHLAAAPFLYAAHHSHSPFGPQVSAGTSPYATIPSFHPAPHPPTIIPPNQPAQSLPFSQVMSYNPTDIQQALNFSLPKHDITKNLMQHPSLINMQKTNATFNGINNDTSRSNTHITDLISSSPLLINSQQAPQSLISPLSTTTSTASLSNIWPYTTGGTPLHLTQREARTAAVTAVAAMSLLNNENSQTEIAQEILKELTTPTKQNNFTLLERRTCLRLRRQLSTTDIDNKISAAMDLVKMHLLSAVREEVTELRQQIRTLNEKINSIEHENAFLRQHVPSEIYAQYIPTFIGESLNPTTSVIPSTPSILSSQTMPMTSLSSLPSSIAPQASISTNNTQPLSSITTIT